MVRVPASADSMTPLGGFTDEQRQIVEAPWSSRLLVDAGPGTGKTAVACGRVAWLVDQAKLNPNEIWVVSFTRTAVQEIRARIRAYLADPDVVTGIRISTIDSFAWALKSGFDPAARMAGSHDDTITDLIELLEKGGGAIEYLQQFRHLLVDEAQDVVGNRAHLLVEIISALSPDAGVSVLADEAQSIFGFADEDAQVNFAGANLPESIREYMAEDFVEADLKDIHRTSDPVLVALLSQGRQVLRDTDRDAQARYSDVRELIQAQCHSKRGNAWGELEAPDGTLDDAFVLFRRRGEALQAASYLGTSPRRLRLPGLPPVVFPWLADVLWDWTELEMPRAEFERRWHDRVASAMWGRPDDSWSTLLRLAGTTETRLSVTRLAQVVASPSPPIDLCLPDYGATGPVIGTIHAAKGRESELVLLFLPEPWAESDQDEDQIDEEARVLFVGASRAKSEFRVGTAGTRVFTKNLPSGRAYSSKAPTATALKAAVELGRNRDITANGLVGQNWYPKRKHAMKSQESVRLLQGRVTEATAARLGPEHGWTYCLHEGSESGQPVAFLEQQVNQDLFDVGGALKARFGRSRANPPRKLPHLVLLGSSTLAVGPDDPVRSSLHEPWSQSGFMSLPLLSGYPTLWFS